MTALQKELFSLQDMDYRAFQCKLMPTVDPAQVIGVRMPALRAFAKEFRKRRDVPAFLASLPHDYYEENNLHALLLERERDLLTLFAELDHFLPYLDNWATCDLLSPKAFFGRPEALPAKIREWMASEHPYIVRFGIGVLLRHYLEEGFSSEYPDAVAAVRSDGYYVKMMVAWYFATALAKQFDAILPYLREQRLDRWTHNKAIQKACESYRITPEQKTFLRTLRR